MSFDASTGTLLAGLWVGYFVLHSVLASLGAKRWVARRWPHGMARYRLGFNLLALLLILPPLWLTFALDGPYLWRWQGPWAWLSQLLALTAIAGFFWSLRYYDGSEFLGLRQWRRGQRQVEDQERFYISPLHRFVRHPWYSLGLVLVWTRDMNGAMLLSAVAISLYFVVGSVLEEHKLLVYHGDVYRRYRAQVPGLIPLPWRYLDRNAAQDLVAAARSKPGSPGA
jgi:protein-S-isoprenylcysteine O-methyltransferase Ste14